MDNLPFDFCCPSTRNTADVGGRCRRCENRGHNRNSVKVSFAGEHHARLTPGVKHIQLQANEGATKKAQRNHRGPSMFFLAQRKRNVALSIVYDTSL